MSSEQTRGSAGRAAVIYVVQPSFPDPWGSVGAHRAAEARQAALAWGLSPLDRVALTQDETDELLAAHPDAALLIHTGGAPSRSEPVPDAALWNVLHAGVVLRLCETEPWPGARPVLPPPRIGSPALLVVDLVTAAGPEGDLPRQELRREEECRAFAARHGLRVLETLTSDPDSWERGDPRTPALSGLRPLTVVVHPEVTTSDANTLDALLLRWLRQGREIRSVPPPGWGTAHLSSPPSVPVVRGSESPASADSFDADESLGATDWVGLPTHAARPAPSLPRSASGAGAGGGLVYNRGYGGHHDIPFSRGIDAGSASAALSTGGGHQGPYPTPRDTTQPLPHDGLFIRRNNAFGTRSILGVKDLIEQGVIVGQDQIRFDDFVAARTDQVPGPHPGEAIAVSHGLAAVQGEFKADEATTHFVEITLKAAGAHPADAPAGEPLPVNFVFVVDNSLSMRGEKLDTVKRALETIYRELRPADCLGIITFNHSVRTVLPAVAKENLPQHRFTEIVAALTADGGTDINLGVQYGIDEIGRHSVSGRTVNCLYLFSDGDPTSGEQDWIKIRTNIAAKLRGDLTVSCFGFGSDARMPELAALAGLAGGHSAFVTRPDQVKTDLQGDLSRRDHLAAIDIQLKLDIDPEVEIRHLYAHDLVTDPRARAAVLRDARQAAEVARRDYSAEALPDIITEEKGIRIFAPDLAFEETYWVVLEVSVPPGRQLSWLGTATVQYVDTLARESRRHEIDLSAAHTLSEEVVVVHAVGLWTSEVTFYALDDLYDRDKEAARNRLTQHINVLNAAHSHLPAKEFRDDRVTLQKLITLADQLGTMMSFTDASHSSGFSPAVRVLNEFGRVRSGFVPRL